MTSFKGECYLFCLSGQFPELKVHMEFQSLHYNIFCSVIKGLSDYFQSHDVLYLLFNHKSTELVRESVSKTNSDN